MGFFSKVSGKENVSAQIQDGETVQSKLFIDSEDIESIRKHADEAYDKGDYATALECYRRSEPEKDSHILARMGYIQTIEGQPFTNMGAGLAAIEKAAELGDAWSQAEMAYRYANAYGVDRDSERAFHLAQMSAAQDDARGLSMLATLYQYGEGCKENGQRAFELHKKAAEYGEPYSQGAYGDYLLLGHYTVENKDEAYKWFKKSAEQGNGWAKYRLGKAYALGIDGIEKNTNEGLRLLNEAAKEEYGEAFYVLGCLYANADGVERDYWKAIDCFKKTLSLNDDPAFVLNANLNLGDCYIQCEDQDVAKALEHYAVAASMGSEDAKREIDRLS